MTYERRKNANEEQRKKFHVLFDPPGIDFYVSEHSSRPDAPGAIQGSNKKRPAASIHRSAARANLYPSVYQRLHGVRLQTPDRLLL